MTINLWHSMYFLWYERMITLIWARKFRIHSLSGRDSKGKRVQRRSSTRKSESTSLFASTVRETTSRINLGMRVINGIVLESMDCHILPSLSWKAKNPRKDSWDLKRPSLSRRRKKRRRIKISDGLPSILWCIKTIWLWMITSSCWLQLIFARTWGCV